MQQVAKYQRYVNGYGMVIVSAKDASALDINPEEVKATCDKITKVAKEHFDKIGDAISKVQCGKEALSVQDTTMQPVLEETGKAIKEMVKNISPYLEDAQAQAMEMHDMKQQQYNDEALQQFERKLASAETQAQENLAEKNS